MYHTTFANQTKLQWNILIVDNGVLEGEYGRLAGIDIFITNEKRSTAWYSVVHLVMYNSFNKSYAYGALHGAASFIYHVLTDKLVHTYVSH